MKTILFDLIKAVNVTQVEGDVPPSEFWFSCHVSLFVRYQAVRSDTAPSRRKEIEGEDKEGGTGKNVEKVVSIEKFSFNVTIYSESILF